MGLKNLHCEQAVRWCCCSWPQMLNLSGLALADIMLSIIKVLVEVNSGLYFYDEESLNAI